MQVQFIACTVAATTTKKWSFSTLASVVPHSPLQRSLPLQRPCDGYRIARDASFPAPERSVQRGAVTVLLEYDKAYAFFVPVCDYSSCVFSVLTRQFVLG